MRFLTSGAYLLFSNFKLILIISLFFLSGYGVPTHQQSHELNKNINGKVEASSKDKLKSQKPEF